MVEVADIIRRHGTALRAYLGGRLLPSQARALRDLVACRTAAGGGQLTQCSACAHQVYRYHSCRNRHCPKCGGDQTARWLARHHARLLPCPHYLITVTVPAALRPLAFGHQAVVYGALMQCAASALQTLAADLDHARTLLDAAHATADESSATPTTTPGAPAPIVCPLCHAGTLTLIAVLRPQRKVPP